MTKTSEFPIDFFGNLRSESEIIAPVKTKLKYTTRTKKIVYDLRMRDTN